MCHSGMVSLFVCVTGNKPYDSKKKDVRTLRNLLYIRFIFSVVLFIQLP